jgi:hypothetical protein
MFGRRARTIEFGKADVPGRRSSQTRFDPVSLGCIPQEYSRESPSSSAGPGHGRSSGLHRIGPLGLTSGGGRADYGHAGQYPQVPVVRHDFGGWMRACTMLVAVIRSADDPQDSDLNLHRSAVENQDPVSASERLGTSRSALAIRSVGVLATAWTYWQALG